VAGRGNERPLTYTILDGMMGVIIGRPQREWTPAIGRRQRRAQQETRIRIGRSMLTKEQGCELIATSAISARLHYRQSKDVDVARLSCVDSTRKLEHLFVPGLGHDVNCRPDVIGKWQMSEAHVQRRLKFAIDNQSRAVVGIGLGLPDLPHGEVRWAT
jgi:hypothetical protein